ncbi:spermidine synthase [Erwinia sp. MMLR14_017]|uniref:spermine/spermidine synthase domain-containing protein n=1 Tax=Erwinia sp. MMLR14_017 TaxID=3093842 RepID=UPI002990019E|nr:spermidine synthase [Erwinia sp. MMLR14_017]MDW8845775.1 spermidine synthase [Erwinia sp. MMLR14_017]
MPFEKLFSALSLPHKDEIKVASERDRYGTIFVVDKRNYRIMRFDSIFEQTKMNRNHPEVPVHNYIKAMLMSAALEKPQSVLVLGLGGGSLVRGLHDYDSEVSIDVVELRKKVITIARKYFFIPDVNNISYFAQDAGSFMEKNKTKYSHIFSDLYSAEDMVSLQKMGEFIKNCAASLTPDGWLVMNYHISPIHSPTLLEMFSGYFGTLLYCTTPSGNVVLYATQSVKVAETELLRKKCRSVSPSSLYDFKLLSTKLSRWV